MAKPVIVFWLIGHLLKYFSKYLYLYPPTKQGLTYLQNPLCSGQHSVDRCITGQNKCWRRKLGREGCTYIHISLSVCEILKGNKKFWNIEKIYNFIFMFTTSLIRINHDAQWWCVCPQPLCSFLGCIFHLFSLLLSHAISGARNSLCADCSMHSWLV